MILTNEQKAKYKIMSRSTCEKYCTQKHANSSIIISIRSSWDKELPKLPISDTNNVKAILSLSFDDVDISDNPKYCMKSEDGDKIVEFLTEWYDKIDTIIVHCDGGISRSAGVCAALMRVFEGDDYPIFDNQKKHPNMTCYLVTLRSFNYMR